MSAARREAHVRITEDPINLFAGDPTYIVELVDADGNVLDTANRKMFQATHSPEIAAIAHAEALIYNGAAGLPIYVFGHRVPWTAF